jgi:hypothetical protein
MRTAFLSLLLIPGIAPASGSRFLFEPNRGQTDPSVRYLARGPHGPVFFRADDVVVHGVRLEFAGANPEAIWETADPVNETISYYQGRDASRWVRDLPRFAKLVRGQLYPGIDAVWYGNGDRLEYDLLLAPHADPSQIRLRAPGAVSIAVESDGGLLIKTRDGQMRQAKPRLFQDGHEVSGSFRLLAPDEAGFSVSAYDAARPLSIDPVLESSSFVGGGGEDCIIATSGAGAYAGMTSSIDFPLAPFARRHGMDILVQTTGYFGNVAVIIIGGSGNETVTGASLSAGSITVVGYTDSHDLPTNLSNTAPYNTPAVWQQDFAGGASDGFVLWIGSQNSSAYSNVPLYLSYFGTPGDDRITAVSSTSNPVTIVGWTTAAGFPVASNLITGQTSPAGGTDGFLAQLSIFSGFASVTGMTYLGGSGDDRPLGIYGGVAGGSLSYYVTGETTSADLPGAASSQRSGATDAFVVRLVRVNQIFSVTGGTLLGGSGSDRGVSVTYSAGNILVGGVTSSTDLPVVNSWQMSYGGGASDAFVAELLPDLSGVVRLGFFGGAGADEATTIVGDVYGNVYLAGWTTSQDLPVRNAIQSQYGGGSEDGFLLHLQADRSIYAATYYGGSGSDRVYGLTTSPDLTVWLAGQTTSGDLPQKKASQPALSGGSDGFLAQVSAPLLGVFRVIGARGFRSSVSLYIGMLDGDSSSPVTITSSDPTSVLVAPDVTSSAQAAVTVPPGTVYAPNYRVYYVDCQVARGGADLTFSAPGYVTTTAHADCYPAQVRTTYSASINGVSPSTPVFSLWGGAVNFSAILLAVNPDQPTDVGYLVPVPGSSGVFRLSSSNPAVGTLSTNTLDFSKGSAGFQFQPLAIGDTVLTVSNSNMETPSTQPVSIVSPLQAPSIELWAAGGFQTQLPGVVGVGRESRTFKLTATSQDPARLLISSDGSQPGSASADTSSNGGLYLQALDSSGEVPVTLSVDGFDPVTTSVHLSTPVVGCSGCAAQVRLGLLEQTFVTPVIRAAGAPLSNNTLSPNPGTAPIRVSLESSDSSVLSTYDPVDIKPGAILSSRLSVTGAAPGNATLTLKASGGLAIDPVTAPAASVTVFNRPAHMTDLDLGKDLAGIMTLSLPAYTNPAVPFTITVGDPSLALLAISATSAGQRQLSLNVTQSTSFYVLGLSASGQTTVTATAPGWGTVTSIITLGPSGFGWSGETLTATLYSVGSVNQYIATYVLDSASMLPIGTQTLRGGITAPITLTNSNPAVATTPASITMGSCSVCSVAVSPKAPGNTTIALAQPPGFSTPAIHQILSVAIARPSVSAPEVWVGKDLQTAVPIGVPGNVTQPLTITSGDPSKALFTTDPAVPGSASVTITSNSQKTVYVQALDSSGTIPYTASTEGFTDGAGKIHLASLGASLSLSQSGYPATYSLVDGVANTSTQSPVTSLSIYVSAYDENGQAVSSSYVTSFRPGVDPPKVEVRSSDPAVGTILRGPAAISFQNTSTVDFKPIASGDTDVTVVQPPGWVAPPKSADKVRFHVSQPGFASSYAVMGKDTYMELSASLLPYIVGPQANVPVTITSGDPSRVLLSSSADATPAASVTKTLIAGKTVTDTLSIHALDNRGLVPLTISAPGYSSGTLTIALSDTIFSFTDYPSSPIRSLIQNGPQSIGIVFRVSPPSLPPAVQYSSYNLSIRPGASIPLEVRSSDTGVLAVDTPQVLVTPGKTTFAAVYRPLGPGSATLTLTPPPGYLPGTINAVTINVESARLTLGSSVLVGRDLQQQASVGAEAPFKQNTPVILTSSDPSRLLLSTSPTTPGSGTIAVLATPNSGAQYWLQALSDSGSVTVSATADGYQAGSLTVNLAPIAAMFTNLSATQTLYTNSAAQTIGVMIGPLNSNLTLAGSYQGPRPGVDFTVGIRSSDTAVMSPTVTSLRFTDGNQQQIQVRPIGAGTAILSLDKLPNGVVPAAGGQIVFNVTEPDLYVPNISLGRDLQAPLQVKLADRLSPPATDVTLTIYTDYSFYVALSNDPAVAGNTSSQSISVVLPAGQRLSRPFYVQASGQNISSGLRVTGGTYTPSTSTVAVAATAFVFREAAQPQPVNVATGSTAAFTVTPTLASQGATLPAGTTIRAGATPIPITVTSSAPGVVSVTPATITLRPGDAQATVNARGVTAGRATLTLGGPVAYQFNAAQSTLDVQVR